MTITNPRLFIGGCPRSGTTLLQRMLDHHPHLAIVNDSHFIPRALEKTKAEGDRLLALARRGEAIPLSQELRDNVIGYHRFYRTGLVQYEFDLIADGATTYQQLVAGIFGAVAKREGKRFAGEKTPDYIKHVPVLLGMFPHARFVNIVRDGRDVALSLSDWATPTKGPGRLGLWGVDPIATSALWWREFVRCGQRYASEFTGGFLTISYEQCVENPESSLRQVCELAQLDYTPQMLEFHIGKRQDSATESAKKQWLPPTAGLRDWRNAMEPDDVAVFHALASEELISCGYEVNNTQTTNTVKQRVAAAHTWWEKETQRVSEGRTAHK